MSGIQWFTITCSAVAMIISVWSMIVSRSATRELRAAIERMRAWTIPEDQIEA